MMVESPELLAAYHRLLKTERPAQHCKVLLVLMGMGTGFNELRIRWETAEIAEQAQLSRRQVSSSMAALARVGVLKRLGKGKYAVNPHLMFRGQRVVQLAEQERFPSYLRPVESEAAKSA
jgi:hypothetical protein